MSAGFYKACQNCLSYASTLVKSSEFELRIEDKDTYEYPIHGWRYFESQEDALAFYEDLIQEDLVEGVYELDEEIEE